METTDSLNQSTQNRTSLNGADKSGNRTAAIHSTVDRLADAAHPAVDKLISTAHQAVDRLAGVASTASQSLGQRTEQFKGAQAQLLESGRAYVNEKPLASLGIAVAVGFVLSRLLSRS